MENSVPSFIKNITYFAVVVALMNLGTYSHVETQLSFQCTKLVNSIKCSDILLLDVEGGVFNCSTSPSGRNCSLTCNDDGYFSPPDMGLSCDVNDIVTWESEDMFACGICNNWTEWSGSRYRYIDSKQSWEESLLKCQEEQDDSHLAYIETMEENEFVLNLVSSCTAEGYLWIGLNDRNMEGEWRWGEEGVGFFKWGSFGGDSEPSGGRNFDEDCGLIGSSNGDWFDFRCGGSYAAVCEHSL